MAFDITAFGIDGDNLPNGWTVDRIDTLADINPEQIGSGYEHSTIAYLDIGNVVAGSIGQPKIMPLRDAPSRARRVVRPGDTILSTVRPGNRAYAFMRAIPDNLVVSTGFAVLRGKDSVDPRFLYYLATSSPLIDYWVSIAEEKSAYPSINPGDIADCAVPIPPLPEQRAIAHILGTLDDKIELNRKMSDTLEAMARALFKAWFVDFEPVRAKMEGRWRRGQSLPGLPAHLYDLFPDQLVDSELGEIPEGWQVASFGGLVKCVRDSENPQEAPDAVFCHFGIPAFDESRWPRMELGAEIKSQKCRVPPGVVLLSKLNPRIERAWLVDVQPGERSVCSTEFVVLSSRPPFGRFYIYCSVRSSSFRKELKGLATGTSKSHQRAQPNAILRLPVVRPPDSLAESFERLVGSLLERALSCRRASRSLADLRDALLPRLVTGALRVSHVAKTVERIAS